MKAMVNEKACIRCGLCAATCPAVFSLEEGESARAIEGDIPTEQQVDTRAAADGCPTSAIEIK